MAGRTLTWTGDAGNGEFGTAANWNNARGRAAMYAPGRAGRVDLIDNGMANTITGEGAVNTINVSGVYETEGASLIAESVVISGLLALGQDSSLRAHSITIYGTQTEDGLIVTEGSTLSAAGAALDVSVGFSQLGANPAELTIMQGGKIDLGAGELAVGEGLKSGAPNEGSVVIDGGTLIGSLYSKILIGSGGGRAEVLLTGGSIATLGSIDVGTGSSSFGSISAEFGTISAALLDVGTGGAGFANFNGTNLYLGNIAGVGLDIDGGQPGFGPSTVTTQDDTVTISGRIEIGLDSDGLFSVGSLSTLTTNGSVDIGSGGYDGVAGTGTLLIQLGAVWHDTGAVRLVSGLLSIAGAAPGVDVTDSIASNLELGGRDNTEFSTSVSLAQVALDVTGDACIPLRL